MRCSVGSEVQIEVVEPAEVTMMTVLAAVVLAVAVEIVVGQVCRRRRDLRLSLGAAEVVQFVLAAAIEALGSVLTEPRELKARTWLP